jgi:hypothetical protein
MRAMAQALMRFVQRLTSRRIKIGDRRNIAVRIIKLARNGVVDAEPMRARAS